MNITIFIIVPIVAFVILAMLYNLKQISLEPDIPVGIILVSGKDSEYIELSRAARQSIMEMSRVPELILNLTQATQGFSLAMAGTAKAMSLFGEVLPKDIAEEDD